MTSETFVRSAFAEFLGCWAAGGEATLSLSTQGGKLTVTPSFSLGRPEVPLHPTPLPITHPARRRRKNRGPARKARDKERAARHQAARATSTPSSPSSPMAPVEEEVPPSRTCRRCGLPCRGHPAPGPGEGRCQVTLATTTTPPPLENLREGSKDKGLHPWARLLRDGPTNSPPPPCPPPGTQAPWAPFPAPKVPTTFTFSKT